MEREWGKGFDGLWIVAKGKDNAEARGAWRSVEDYGD
jgi:hypothetical protein